MLFSPMTTGRNASGKIPRSLAERCDIGKELYEITGVVDGPFTGTEPGTMTDIFLPAMMHPSVTRSDASWARTLVLVKSETALEPLRQKLSAISRASNRNGPRDLPARIGYFFRRSSTRHC